MNEQLVAILDNETLAVMFEAASLMKLSVTESKRATKFQVEDGTERSDHVVQEANEIQIDFMLTEDTRNVFQDIRQAWLDNRLLAIQSKVNLYENMLITEIPHEEAAGSAITIPIRMTEWRPVMPEYGELPPRKVRDKKQSDTVNRGQVQTTESSEERKKKASWLGGAFKK